MNRLIKCLSILFFLIPSISFSQAEIWGVTTAGGDGFGSMFSMPTGSTGIAFQRNFTGFSGASPLQTKVIQASNGKLYGTTSAGGSNGVGVLFEYDIATGTYTKRHDFVLANGSAPRGTLMQASNGKLYGTTTAGGTNNAGVIFEFDITTNTYVKKVDLLAANGGTPFGGLMELNPSNGKLYGLTRFGGSNSVGTIFEYDLASGVYTKKIDLVAATGSNPNGELVQSGSLLYGVTPAGGTNSVGVIFEYDYTLNTYTKKFDMVSSTGGACQGSLFRASDGNLYGLASNGGSANVGAIFQYSISSVTYTKLFDLTSGSGGTGTAPLGNLIQGTNGNLYGVTRTGGLNNHGTLFEYNLTTSTFTKKIDLQNNANIGGTSSTTLLQASNGHLYGVTTAGGIIGSGVIFEYNLGTSTYTKKIDFNHAPGGGVPNGGLIYASNSKLYGTTISGGANNVGTIFEYDKTTNTYTVRVSMTSSLGAAPYGSLMQASNGKLYGLANGGGANSVGALFEYDITTNTYTKKIDLSAATLGSTPFGHMIQASNGLLYGMTRAGGTSGLGVIFEYNTATNTYTKKKDFTGATTGSQPSGSFLEAPNGKLYALTQLGGANAQGAIIEYDIATNTLTKKFDFAAGATTGNQPLGSLVLANDNNLYGFTRLGGANSLGTLFRYDYVNNTFTKLVDLTTALGSTPQGSLIKAASGKLYALTQAGGTNSVGTMVEFDVPTATLTKIMDLSSSTGSSPGYTRLLEICPKPATPGLISSSSNSLCEGNTTGQTFNVGSVATATSYVWTLPSGATITGGTNTNSISASFSAVASGVYTYSVEAVNACGNGSASTKSFSVDLAPTVSVTNGTVCAGSPFTISPTGASSYSISGGSSVVSPTITTNYSVTGLSSGGCVSTNTAIATVSVIALPVVTASSSANSVCTGGTVTLNGGGATTYSWTNSVTNAVAFSPSATLIYTVTGTDGNGCQNTATRAVTVNPLPVVTASSSANSVCTGGTVTLNGGGATSYLWTNGVTNGIAFVPASTLTYTVTGTDGNGCQNTATRAVTVNALPVVTASSSANSVCTGGTVTLNGGGATTYSWTNGVTNGLAFVPASTITYTVTGTNGNGCQNTATRAVTVNPLPVVTASSSANSVCNGGTVTLNGGGATTYSWTNGVTNGLAFVPASTLTYTVTGTDGNGCQNTATRAVTVNPLPVVTASSSANSVCTGGTVTLNGGGATTYSWTNGVTNGLAFAPASTLTYTVTGTDGNGCQNTATRAVTVNPLPVVTASSSANSVCTGGTVTLNGGGATTYSWTNGVTNGLAFVPASTLTYTVTGTDGNGCQNTATRAVTVNALPVVTASSSANSVCNGGTVTLNGGGATTYSWTNGVTNAVAFSPSATLIYTVTGTDGNGCQNTATRAITVNALPVVTASSSVNSLCIGGMVTLNGGGATTYSWSNGVTNAVAFSPTATLIYTVTGTDGNGCQNTATSEVTVNPLPAVTASSTANSVCIGGTVTLNGGGATTYSWTNGVTNALAFVPASTLTYTVTGTDVNGCQNAATIAVTVNPLPVITASSSAGSICDGGTVTLSGGGATTYSWSNGVTNAVAFSPSVTLTYTVTGTDVNGCQNTATSEVTVNPLPVVTGSASNPVICLGGTTTLNGNGALTYSWTGGVTDAVSFSPTTTTSYSLSGTNTAGCTSTNAVVVTVTVNLLPVVAVNSGSICSGQAFTVNATGASSYIITGGSFVVTPTVSTNYSVTGTSTDGCVSSTPAIASVSVFLTPTISAGGGSICNGNSFTITPTLNTGSAFSFTYSELTSTISPLPIVVTPSVNTSYSIAGTDIFGCEATNTAVITVTVRPLPVISATSGAICLGEVFTHSLSGATNYTYSSGGSTVSPVVTTTYNIVGSSNFGCLSANPATVVVVVNPLPTVNVTGTGSLCAGSSVTLTASGANSYYWGGPTGSVIVVNPTVNTVYSVIGTDTNSCSAIAAISVSVIPAPSITVNDGVVCLGDTYTIVPSGASSYTFSGGSPLVTPTVTTTYSVTGTTSLGCVSVQPALVTVTVVNVIVVTITGNSTVCAGETVTLSAGGALSYSWSNGSTSSVITLPTSSASVNSYTVVGTNGSCKDSTDILVNVNPLPLLLAVSSSSTICLNEIATLSVTGANSYTWLPSGANSLVVNVTPSLTISYTVIGQDINGCINSTSLNLNVEPCVGIDDPTRDLTFSLYPNPNLGIFNIEVGKEMSMTIQNMLGEIILKQNLTYGKNEINLGSFAKGVYFVKLNDSKSTETIKIVKQ